MGQNCKCVIGVEDPKAVVRKELAAGYDQYCKDAFSQGLSAMAWQEWMIDRLIEAQGKTDELRAMAETKVAKMQERIEELERSLAWADARVAQHHQTFRAQEHKIAELHERIEKFEQLPNNGFTTLYATIVKNGEPVTIYTMDQTNIEHWKRRALSAEAHEANEISGRLAAQDRAEKAEASLDEKLRAIEALSHRLDEIAGIATK
jgi:DNA repair exonuclease SbcCD ATPase subunit